VSQLLIKLFQRLARLQVMATRGLARTGPRQAAAAVVTRPSRRAGAHHRQPHLKGSLVVEQLGLGSGEQLVE
jgi:hypothetical protein